MRKIIIFEKKTSGAMQLNAEIHAHLWKKIDSFLNL